MATLYHLHAKTFSRSRGHNAIAAAAYRAGVRLYDSRTGEVFDYRNKNDVEASGIFRPQDAPDWTSDRQLLWPAVELAERRVDSQLCREVEVALPRQFTSAQCWQVVEGFARSQFVDWGMVADVSMHRKPTKDPDNSADQYERHAHIMLTLREIGPDGFGRKVRGWNRKHNLEIWREAWATTVNQHLKETGIDECIDHRTLAAQKQDAENKGEHWRAAALDRIPEPKIGRAARYGGSRLKAHPRLKQWQTARMKNKAHLAALTQKAMASETPLKAMAEIRAAVRKSKGQQSPARPRGNIVRAVGRVVMSRLIDEEFAQGSVSVRSLKDREDEE